MTHGLRKGLLLMRRSPPQVFMANTLFRQGAIDAVYIEAGAIGEPDGLAFMRRVLGYGVSGVWRRIVRDAAHFEGDYHKLLDYYVVRFRTRTLMADQRRYDRLILGGASQRLDPGLQVVGSASINEPGCRQFIQVRNDHLVFVFGTGLLKEELLGVKGVTFVNVHFGWLPRFRGEGIISALAEEGVEALGVSVHVVDQGIDTGPILYRERLRIEPGENAYAIGLRATVRGAELFLKVWDDVQQDRLQGTPQAPAEGRCYSSRYLKTRYRMREQAQQALAAYEDLHRRRDPTIARLRASLASGAAVTGLTALGRRQHGHQLRILMYHGVCSHVQGPASFGDLFITASAFARQMAYLKRHFHVLALDQVIDVMERRGAFPERAVMITLDDGYRNVLTTAWPVLRQYGLPATVFLPAGQVDDRSCSWFDVLRVVVAECANRGTVVHATQDLAINGRFIQHPERTFLDLALQITTLPSERAESVMARLTAMGQQVRALDRYPEFAMAEWDEWRAAISSGLMTVGSHGMRHRNLRQLSPAECLEDLQSSKRRIEEALSMTCRAVAYPYGAWDEGVLHAASVAGYACGLTTDEGLNESGHHPLMLRRTMIGDQGNFALFCARVSGVWGWRRVPPRPHGERFRVASERQLSGVHG